MTEQDHQPKIDEVLVPFLLKHCEASLFEVLVASEFDKHYGVPVSLAQLAAYDYGIVDVLLAHPRSILPFLDLALVKAQTALLQRDLPDRHLLGVKENVHARLHGPCLFLDKAAKAASPSIDNISAGYLDRLITVRGTVVRTGAVKLLEARRLYECSKCHHRFVVAADLEMGATVQLPSACPSTRDKSCSGTNFKHCEEVSLYTNYQEIQIQEEIQCMAVGGSSKTLTVMLQDELADTCQVGEIVEVTGVVVKQFGPMFPGVRCHVGIALQATSMVVAGDRRHQVKVSSESKTFFLEFWAQHRTSSTPLAARNRLVASMCPQLCGLFSVKLASLLMLIGGVQRGGDQDQDLDQEHEHRQEERNLAAAAGGGGGKVRGEVHFLLIGDPGTGKSQFQRYISKISARAVLTSGQASSAAGLTAAAVKDGAHWCLEAGALVLADGGVCCIDEFDSLRPADRTALHEAMEQQTCSIAKAGMVTTLHTRASVFGTCNPRGHRKYNPRRPLAEQLDISGPLLSRFDIVLLLLDDLNPVWDEAVADHILEAHRRQAQGAAAAAAATATPSPDIAGRNGNIPKIGADETYEWGVELMREYVAYVKSEFRPILTPAAEEVLSGYYRLRRAAAGRHAARTTVRLLESLVRVAQAHARLMAKDSVDVQDAVVAVALIDGSVVDGEPTLSLPADVGIGAPGDSFPEQPDLAYRRLEAAVLQAVRQCVTAYLPWHGDGDGNGND